jgi:hypothetical protein
VTIIEAEGLWLAHLDERSKISFLVTLARELTIVGRASYIPQSEELSKPIWLRKVNEVQHRVLACLSDLLHGANNLGFERSIAEWVLNQQDDELAKYMLYAWARVKEAVNQ